MKTSTLIRTLNIVLGVILLGFVAPKLVSAASALAVVMGFVAVVGYLYWSFFLWAPKIKKLFNGGGMGNVAPVILALFMLSTAACTKVPAGNVGVKFYLLGGDKGIDTEELSPGRYWIGINEELYLFPTFTQNYTWTQDSREGSENDESITFQTAEGLSVGGDFGVTYSIDPTKVSGLFQRYRKGIDEITDIFLRNMVRDAVVVTASNLPVESVYGTGKASFIEAVEVMVRNQVHEQGINVEKIYLVGDLRLPQTVTNALNRKIEAIQEAEQRQYEIEEAKARATKDRVSAEGKGAAILAEAKAQAEANLILARSITPDLVKWRQLEKWNGEYPQVVGGESGVLLNMGNK